MSTSQNQRDEPKAPLDQSTVILLLGDIADTTWRMFVPPLVGAVLGWWADNSWHTTPWLALTGLGIGIIICALLVKQQFKKVKNDN
ncbi:MAG: AtpZ/AtpI family protein [Candidatus Saccharibacteria bacterium]